LPSLTDLYFQRNPLSGTFRTLCNTNVVVTNTAVTLCGCAASGSPSAIFPPARTSLECLSTGPATALSKRVLVFSQNIDSLRFTCNTDTNGNPYQDCLNAQGAICNPNYIEGNSDRIKTCKDRVNEMTTSLSLPWQNVRKYCGKWSFNDVIGSPDSLSCNNTNILLQKNAFYTLNDGTTVRVTPALTESVMEGLWRNPALQ